MREAVPDLAGDRLPRSRRRRCGNRLCFGPVAAWPAEHTAQETPVRPPFEKDRAVLAHAHEGDAAPGGLFRLRHLQRQVGGDAGSPGGAGRPQRAEAAGGVAGRADGGTQIHHGLREIAGPRRWCDPRREGREFGLGRGQGRLHREEPGQERRVAGRPLQGGVGENQVRPKTRSTDWADGSFARRGFNPNLRS